MDDPGGQPIGLARIHLADKPLFDKAFAALAQPTTDYSFAATYIWSTSLKLYWARVERHICLFANGTGDLTMLMPPIPEPGAAEGDLRVCLERCFQIMDDYNDRIGADRLRGRIEYVSDEMLERLGTVRGFCLSAAPMGGDYVYDMARMIDLAGGSLKSKRHARSKFIRDYPNHRTEPLEARHVPACLDLLHVWCDHGDKSHDGEVNDAHVGSDILRHRDTLSCEVALDHWRELGMKGMVLFVGDTLVGFTLGEAISPTQASILIEKTHPDYHGSAQFIFSEFCRQYWSEYPECNAGDDWGIPSLRFTKQSYRPTRLLSKYVLTRQVPVVTGAPAIDMPIDNPAHGVAPVPASATAESAPVAQATIQPTILADASNIIVTDTLVPTDGVPSIAQTQTPAPDLTPASVVESPANSDADLRLPSCSLVRTSEPPGNLFPGTQEIRITPSRPTDTGGILDLERTCFACVEETFNKRQVRYLMNCPRATVAVARDDHGNVVGWSVGLVRQHRRGKSGRLYAVAVRPDMQGRKIGRELVRHTLDSLAALGIERVYLEVRNDNQPAIGLYRKMGFGNEKLMPNYYAQGRHAFRMVLHQVASVEPIAVQATVVNEVSTRACP